MNVIRKKLSSGLTGAAGLYAVALELTRRGYIASPTLRNAKGVDILATNEEMTKTVSIQVKTNQGYRNAWTLNEAAENYRSPNLFYVLVNLGTPNGHPEFHIVPSAVVADFITTSHREWLQTPGKGGRKHQDNPMRKFCDATDEFKDRWELLGLE